MVFLIVVPIGLLMFVLFHMSGNTTVKFFSSSITWKPFLPSNWYLALILSNPTLVPEIFFTRRLRLLFTINLFPAVVNMSMTNGKFLDKELCFTTFSTNNCKESEGSRYGSYLLSISRFSCTASPCLVCNNLKYESINFTSFSSVLTPSSLFRSRYRYTLLNSFKNISAFSLSSLISEDNVLKQLKRKCGFTWLFKAYQTPASPKVPA